MSQYSGINSCVIRYSELSGITKKEAEKRLRDMLLVVEEELLSSTDGIQFINFLTLRKVERKQKVGRNPRNIEDTCIIPKNLGIKAELGKRFKKLLNKAE